jgi:protein phosphatase PTC1
MNRPKDGYFAVFDGHGSHRTAAWAADNFHSLLEKNIQKYESILSPDQILADSFSQADKLLLKTKKHHSGDGEEHQDSGSTAAVVYIHYNETTHESTLYTANVGDTRIVLGARSGAYRLSKDHRACDAGEQNRIRQCGGIIYNDRVFAVLSITRALGDHQLKDYVISRPYTAETVLEADDECLILACDGLWDVCDDDTAVEMIRDIDNCETAAKVLVDYALKRGSMDNITCMVVRWSLEGIEDDKRFRRHQRHSVSVSPRITNRRKRRISVHHNDPTTIHRRPPSPGILPSIWSESTPKNSDSEFEGDFEETAHIGSPPSPPSGPIVGIQQMTNNFKRLSINNEHYRYGVKRREIPLDFNDSYESDAILEE